MTTTIPNKSFLSNNKYEFVINRLPNLVFFLQGINIPNISLGTTITQTPFVQIPKPSNTLTFEPLNINYIIDEDMKSWFELYTWMTNLGNPESLNKLGILTNFPGKNNSVTSDATLFVKTNSNNLNIKFTFYDIFPTELNGVQLTSTEGQEFLTSTVTFSYTYYTAEKI